MGSVSYRIPPRRASGRAHPLPRDSMPLAPVGGTMCAASPSRKSFPNCMGETTKLRMGVIPFWKIGPSLKHEPFARRHARS